MKYLFVSFVCFSFIGCVAAVGEPLEPKYIGDGCTSLESNPSYTGQCLKMGDFYYPYTGCKNRPIDCVLPYGAIATEKTENNIYCCK